MAEKYKTVAEIIAERDRLRAECAALRADAERYRKLRDGQNWPAAFSRCDAPECTCAAKDMTFGRCCKVTPNA